MSDEIAVQTEKLTKTYPGGVQAVADLDLTIRKGEVFGFLGRNGAGKTTTLRMLVGLVRPTSGTIRVFGETPGTPRQLGRVGALIEAPAFYPHLSGLDNMLLAARYAGVPDSEAHRVLAEVGLTERMHHRFRTYSLGMKQRLGVAVALLKSPDLLILDEPTNGLDPAGVASMRELLREIGRGGRTVLLSSHVLGEVEQVCDRVAVIDAGRLVAEGKPSELGDLLTGGGIIVAADPQDRAISCLREHEAVQSVQIDGEHLRVVVDPAHTPELNRRLVAAGVDVRELRPFGHSLEDAFLALTGRGAKDPQQPSSTLEAVR
ncbi:MAG TPA: ABC transporter ATP-binding protein [Micromonosporaceae bacterium]